MTEDENRTPDTAGKMKRRMNKDRRKPARYARIDADLKRDYLETLEQDLPERFRTLLDLLRASTSLSRSDKGGSE